MLGSREESELDVAWKAERFLDSVCHPNLVYDCTSSKVVYELCYWYGVRAIEAPYLKAALEAGAGTRVP